MSSSSPVPGLPPSSPSHVPPSSPPGQDAFGSSSPLPFASPSTPRRVAGTPRRGELGSGGRRQQFEAPPSSQSRDDARGVTSTDNAGPTSDNGPAIQTLIWGTNVSVADTQRQFHAFIKGFPDEEDPKYLRLLHQIFQTKRRFLNLDCQDLRETNPQLYKQLEQYPQEVIPIFDLVVNEVFLDSLRVWVDDEDLERHHEEALETPIQVRTFNLSESTSLRDLNPSDVDQLVSIKGMVIRTSPIIPDPKEAFFECQMCRHSAVVEIDRGHIIEPARCMRCTTERAMLLVHNRCKFSDKQMVKLQETPENIPDGQAPQTLISFAYSDLCDSVQPGDRVEVTGIYRATPLRVSHRQRTVKSVYKTHIDVVHFNKMATNRLQHEDAKEIAEDPEVAEERIAKLMEGDQRFSAENRYASLAAALAPNIYGLEDVKKGILLQLFGGANKTFEQSARGRFRGDINILMCGDPGVSKSQLLQYAVNLAARGLYTSGKGSSSVGLTAYVTKDPETKQLVLESGALVLCDGGVCCIDEFDKMSDSTRSVLHEAMEQQTVSIAKAGIICSLNARTSILAAANPVDSRWNRHLSIVDNIKLPPTLLSRFDLIFLLLDTPNEEADRKLAAHMTALYFSPENRARLQREEFIPRATLTQYITYARKRINPVLSESASRELVQGYCSLRQLGGSTKTVTATTRQLESMIRLAEAHAKMRLSETVEESDVHEAIRLMKTALQQAATDPRTGVLDMDLITTGTSMAARSLLSALGQEVLTQLGSKKTGMLMSELENVLTNVSREELEQVVRRLQQEGTVIVTGRSSGNPTIALVVDEI